METIKELKQILDEKINEAEQVFLTPHMYADFDTIASSIGMYLIVRKLGKDVSIILDESLATMEPGVKKIVDELKCIQSGKEKIVFINSEKYQTIKSDNDLLITLDVNKKGLVSCQSYLDDFKNIILIDHHNEEEGKTIDTEYKYIDITLSSVSELVTDLLCLYGIKYDSRIGDYLLSGIMLDTDKLSKKSSSKTFKTVAKLIEKGASMERVNELFAYDFVSDRKVQGLVDKTQFLTYTFAVAMADDDVIYNREELAKAADYLLKFNADASFAIGYISENEISISARSSKEVIDVSEVMKELGGGGNAFSAATKITDMSMEEVGKSLYKSIKPKAYIEKKYQNK